jgi:hypothetical protein
MSFEKKRFEQAMAADIAIPSHASLTSCLHWLIFPHQCALKDFVPLPPNNSHTCGEVVFSQLENSKSVAIFRTSYPCSALDVCSQPLAVLTRWCQHLLAQVDKLASNKLVWYLHEHPGHSPQHPGEQLSQIPFKEYDVVMLYPKSIGKPPTWLKSFVDKLRAEKLSVLAIAGGDDDDFYTKLVSINTNTVWISVNTQKVKSITHVLFE